jgi:hypothetical protein
MRIKGGRESRRSSTMPAVVFPKIDVYKEGPETLPPPTSLNLYAHKPGQTANSFRQYDESR